MQAQRAENETVGQRALSHLEVARACFREAEVVSHWRTAHEFRKLGQQYLNKAKRLDPNIFASAPALKRLPWRPHFYAV